MLKSCVAVNCTNHNFMTEKKLTFHIFPNKESKRENADGSKWETKGRYVYLCSEHFITSMFGLNFC